jgi:hypothetical protein
LAILAGIRSCCIGFDLCDWCEEGLAFLEHDSDDFDDGLWPFKNADEMLGEGISEIAKF